MLDPDVTLILTFCDLHQVGYVTVFDFYFVFYNAWNKTFIMKNISK